MAAIKVEDRHVQFVADFEDTCLKQSFKTAILTPFVEMIARYLPGHLRLIVRVTSDRCFFPLTPGMQYIQDVVKDLVEWLLADKATFRFRKMWFDVRQELSFRHWTGIVDTALLT